MLERSAECTTRPPAAAPTIASAPEAPRWWAWRLTAFFAVAGILAARKSFALTSPQFWAEDLPIFFDRAWRNGVASLWEPYGGYLHLWPRVVALFAVRFDPAAAPWIYNGVAWLTAAAVLGSFVSTRGGVAPGRALLFAVLPVLLPHSGEVFCNLTNVQWFTALWFVAVLLKRAPETREQIAGDFGGLAIAGFTGPFALLFLPAFVIRAAREKTKVVIVAAALVAVAAGVQLACLVTTPFPATTGGARAGFSWADVYVERMVVQTLFAAGWQPVGSARWVMSAAFVAAVIWAGATARQRWPVAPHLTVIGLLLPALVLLRFGELLPLFTSHQNGDRYFYFARILAMWVLLLAAEAMSRVRWAGVICVMPLCSVMATLASNFCASPWEDLRWSDYCVTIRRAEAVRIPTHPVTWSYDFPGKP